MRAVALIPFLVASCAVQPPREPGLEGFLHILRNARDARDACAGLGRECGATNLEAALARAEAAAPADLLLDPGQAGEERPLVQAALQAAHADCRGRGIRPGSPRWDRCRLDQSIARLSDVAGRGQGGGAPAEDRAETGWSPRFGGR